MEQESAGDIGRSLSSYQRLIVLLEREIVADEIKFHLQEPCSKQGTRRVSESSHRTVSVLFTDLEGSTDLRTSIGDDAAHTRFRAHDQIMQDEIARWGGIAGTHRYRVTDFGLRSALFVTRTYEQLLRPGLSAILVPADSDACDRTDQSKFRKLNVAIEQLIRNQNLAA